MLLMVFDDRWDGTEKLFPCWELKLWACAWEQLPWSQRFFLIFLRERNQEQAAKRRQRIRRFAACS